MTVAGVHFKLIPATPLLITAASVAVCAYAPLDTVHGEPHLDHGAQDNIVGPESSVFQCTNKSGEVNRARI